MYGAALNNKRDGGVPINIKYIKIKFYLLGWELGNS